MITCVFGLPGQGKSTYSAYRAYKALTTKKGKKRYDRVYANFDIVGCYPFSYENLGVYQYENCLILLDEAGLEADSRKFASFTENAKYFFSNHRHYGCDIIYFSQAWDDVDKKIRNNTEELLYIRKFLWWSVIVPIKRLLFIDDLQHQIVSGYAFKGLLSWSFIFRPKYYWMFDSYQRRELLPVPPLLKYAPLPIRENPFKGLGRKLKSKKIKLRKGV